ncbi:MAG: FecR domain-containing protein [Planctomycetes bacterium]|nr:FecR domain-containing protein [Planctomycetota bacterium]
MEIAKVLGTSALGAAALGFLLFPVLTPAEDSAPVPEAEPEAPPGDPAAEARAPLLVTIIQVEGSVEVRLPGEEAWKPAAVDMTLPEASELSTGFASRAAFRTPEGATLLVRPLTQLKIGAAYREEDVSRLEVELKIGKIRAEASELTGESDLRVRTPRLTASVRGTVFEFQSLAHRDSLFGVEGVTRGTDPSGLARDLHARDATNERMVQCLEAMRMERVLDTTVQGLSFGEGRINQKEAMGHLVSIVPSGLGLRTGMPLQDGYLGQPGAVQFICPWGTPEARQREYDKLLLSPFPAPGSPNPWNELRDFLSTGDVSLKPAAEIDLKNLYDFHAEYRPWMRDLKNCTPHGQTLPDPPP